MRGHKGEVLLCHGHKGPAARLAVSYSGCSSPPLPPLPLLPLPLLPTPLLLSLVLYSSFLSPSSLLLHHLCLCLCLLLLLLPFLFFLPHPLPLQSEETKDYFIPISVGHRPTELWQWIAHEEASLGLSSVFLLVAQPGAFPSSCSPMPSAHKYILHLYTLNALYPLANQQHIFLPQSLGEVTYRCTKPQNCSYS